MTRKGLALPAAVFTLAVVTLFIAGSAFITSEEARASVGTLAQRQALEAAEYGATAVLRDWNAAWNLGTPVGATVAASHALASGATSDVRLTRTTATTWWAVSTGTAGATTARRAATRTVNAVFRLDLAADAIEAALSATDSVRVVPGGLVAGTDSIELAGCPFATTSVAGVASPDTTRTCDGACGSSGTGITGLPRLLADSAIAALVAGTSASLAATIVVAGGSVLTPSPVTSAGACDTTVATNWGDPLGGPCAGHLPVVRVLGDLTIRGGRGQGVIVANGDVTLDGGAVFAGLVIALDDIETSSGGGMILGAALAGDSRRGTADHSTIRDGGVVRRSSCRVARAQLARARPVRVVQRWWMEFD